MNYLTGLIAGTLWSLAFVACSSCSGFHPPVPIEPGDTSDCAAACANLEKLGCDEGKPLEDGTTCTKFCKDTQKSGHGLKPSCVVNLKACGEIESCSPGR